MIRGHCQTNLDDYKKEEWPTVFAENIAVGHRVRAHGGASLCVVNITHTVAKAVPYLSASGEKNEPHVIVELHKRI